MDRAINQGLRRVTAFLRGTWVRVRFRLVGLSRYQRTEEVSKRVPRGAAEDGIKREQHEHETTGRGVSACAPQVEKPTKMKIEGHGHHRKR